MNMKQRSKKEQFYMQVGEAMSMNNMRSFINVDTLEWIYMQAKITSALAM